MTSALLSTLASACLSLGMAAGVPVGAPGDQPQAGQPVGPQPGAVYDPRADIESVGGIVRALYECTAGPPGQPRDWDRLRHICHPEARFFAVRPDGAGGALVFPLTVEDYIMHNKKYFEGGGFSEIELARRSESFGNITQVWSTFESRLGSPDAAPHARGVYSLQLLRDGDRWWMLSCAWDMETEENPLPERYLRSPGADGEDGDAEERG